ncbi:hypothetical protein G6011_07773 [Alternaria panax]|uniref:Uncharacterized protein n=1 Tax=Alternaria panax TaxID=48097 RepID=A0AAD4F7I4_9PLEO|nr:hypothetical protein G6011_07773 [Alternaria panax]
MHSPTLAFMVWFAILALALPQSVVATVTQSAPTPTQPKKTPGFWPGFINRPSPKPKQKTVNLLELSSILIPGPTPTRKPTPTPTGTSPGSVVWITATPGGGVTKVTVVSTSVVMASLPLKTVTTWVRPSKAAKREEKSPEEEDEDAHFVPALTHLPEAVLEPEDDTDDMKDDTSLPPSTNEPTTLRCVYEGAPVAGAE